MNKVMTTTGVSDKLQRMMKNSGLEESQALKVIELFKEYNAIAEEWMKKAKSIVVKDVSDVSEMMEAEEGFKIVQRMRIDAEKTRKMLKERSINEGRFIEAVANELKGMIAPIEEHLKAQKDFIKNKEAAEAEERRLKAEELLREQEAKAAAKAEKERLAKEKADREERERIAKELDDMTKHNAKLQKEAEKRERERMELEEKARKEREEADRIARIEREEQDKILADERKERERLEAELKAQIKCPNCGHTFAPNKS